MLEELQELERMSIALSTEELAQKSKVASELERVILMEEISLRQKSRAL